MKDFEYAFSGKVYSEEELGDDIRALVQTAKEACKNSYAPYSHFHVGTAVLLSNGLTVSGSNQENIAYPSGLCAERVALFAATSTYPGIPVEKIALAAMTKRKYTCQPVSPCGACRQVLSEISKRYGNKIQVILYGTDSVYVIDDARQLLPIAFDAEIHPDSHV